MTGGRVARRLEEVTTTEPAAEPPVAGHLGAVSPGNASGAPTLDGSASPGAGHAPGRRPRLEAGDDHLDEASAGLVLHRVLATAARTFLLNDLGDEAADEGLRSGTLGALDQSPGDLPLWARSLAEPLAGTERRDTPLERVHQSRVAMRRIRSNLRTYRLLLAPAWGTSLRAELAWYGNLLGHSRDLDLLADLLASRGAEVLEDGELAELTAVVDAQRRAALAEVDAERAGSRRRQLVQQMLVLWEGPAYKAKAAKPATEVLPRMLERTWRDVRGAARTARKHSTDAHLHGLRIRLKDLRYGCETAALVEGKPARRTAKAAERLQTKLGDLHDAVFSIEWLEAVAAEHPDLAAPAATLVEVQRRTATDCRKGWRHDLKEIDRRWRRWHD